jgi:RNA polymerase primary sigma factor
MKTARRKRSGQPAKVAESSLTTFSSDLLTPEEERELLTGFWDCKSELVRVLLRNFPRELQAHRPPLEPWPMAQFIREHCTALSLIVTSLTLLTHNLLRKVF